MQAPGLNDYVNFARNQLEPALSPRLTEMTLSDSPQIDAKHWTTLRVKKRHPTTPTQAPYLVYDVVRAEEFESTGWDMPALASKPDKAAQGHPFAISLLDLMLVSKKICS